LTLGPSGDASSGGFLASSTAVLGQEAPQGVLVHICPKPQRLKKQVRAVIWGAQPGLCTRGCLGRWEARAAQSQTPLQSLCSGQGLLQAHPGRRAQPGLALSCGPVRGSTGLQQAPAPDHGPWRGPHQLWQDWEPGLAEGEVGESHRVTEQRPCLCTVGRRALLPGGQRQRSPFDLASRQPVHLALAALHPKLQTSHEAAVRLHPLQIFLFLLTPGRHASGTCTTKTRCRLADWVNSLPLASYRLQLTADK
jgi:hypothetical protein